MTELEKLRRWAEDKITDMSAVPHTDYHMLYAYHNLRDELAKLDYRQCCASLTEAGY